MSPALPKLSVTAPDQATRIDTILAHVLDAAAIGMLVCDMNGVVKYANTAVKTMLGDIARPNLGTALADLVHDDDGAAVFLQIQRLLRGEAASYRGEHQFRHDDGSSLWVLVAASVLHADPNDGGPCVIIQITSIDRQKAAEAALAFSESRLNFALESARQGVWDHDIRTDTMFYSRMWRVMRGIPPDEDVDGDQAKWLSRIHPDDVQYVLDNVARQDRGDDDFDALEYRERKRDGSYVWILSRGKPVEWDEAGNAVRTLGTDTDITQLKTVELELAAEKERLRITLESIADGMISTDAGGHVVFMNPAAEVLTGFSSQKAMGRPVRDVFPLFDGESGERQRCPVSQCLETGQVAFLDGDLVLVGPNGIERDIRCTASPVKMATHALAGVVL
ncbi:MAG: PAS domain S-box protein, partial [Alphaproteobacteria bacterium]|nr:PAS domain S-box protein [Alphaproteobacteria bacterium]